MCKRLICWVSFVLVLGLAFASAASAADPNLVGWWPLDDGAGETVVDLSGSGNDGTINNPANGLGADGSVWVEDADRGTVVSFDGTAGGAYVSAGSIPQMTTTRVELSVRTGARLGREARPKLQAPALRSAKSSAPLMQ